MKRRAFTLVELLVVIGIIAVLAGLSLVGLPRIWHSAYQTRMQADLHILSLALEAYQQDFGDYPRLLPSQKAPGANLVTDAANPAYLYGSELLCWALLAPYPATGGGGFALGDGCDGPGFRVRGVQGQVRGPYVDASKFPLLSGSRYGQLSDQSTRPILYFARNLRAPATYADRADAARWDLRYDEPVFADITNPADPPAVRAAARLAAFQTRLPAGIEAPYLLWSAGKDERHGTEDDILVHP
jgi:prepilin-type N-terminal cleavage/methylation domain-containing protein